MHSLKIDFLSPQTNNMSNPSQSNIKLEKSELEPFILGCGAGFDFNSEKKFKVVNWQSVSFLIKLRIKIRIRTDHKPKHWYIPT
jgi:hypothetical protein